MFGRTQHFVPEVYVNESRDFALLVRAYDCIFQGVKFDIDSMKYVTDTQRCNDRVLQLLQTKVGFFSEAKINNEDMRYILRAFPYIIRNKGSYSAIIQAVYVFLKISNIKSDIFIYEEIIDGNRTHNIRIGIEEKVRDISILEEILKYVVPAGYYVSYFFYKKWQIDEIYSYKDSVLMYVVSNKLNSQVRGSNELGGSGSDPNIVSFTRSVGTSNVQDQGEDSTAVFEKIYPEEV